jgi:hypothetical protein
MEQAEAAAVTSDVLTEAMDRVRQFGSHAGRFSYSGVRVDGDVMTVYRVPNPGFDLEVRTLLGDVPYRLEDAAHPRADLIVVREMAWLIEGGFEVESVVVPEDGSKVRVFVAGSTWDAQEELDRAAPGCAEVVASRRNLESLVPVTVERRGLSR